MLNKENIIVEVEVLWVRCFTMEGICRFFRMYVGWTKWNVCTRFRTFRDTWKKRWNCSWWSPDCKMSSHFKTTRRETPSTTCSCFNGRVVKPKKINVEMRMVWMCCEWFFFGLEHMCSFLLYVEWTEENWSARTEQESVSAEMRNMAKKWKYSWWSPDCKMGSRFKTTLSLRAPLVFVSTEELYVWMKPTKINVEIRVVWTYCEWNTSQGVQRCETCQKSSWRSSDCKKSGHPIFGDHTEIYVWMKLK